MSTATEIAMAVNAATPRAAKLAEYIERTVLRECFRIAHARCMWRLHLIAVRNAAQFQLTYQPTRTR